MATDLLLEARRLQKSFGGLMAVNNVDFQICADEVVALIGPNGAGKTTIFNLLSGTHQVDGGEVFFKGQPIHGLRAGQIASRGLVRTFQNLQIFGHMTVLENVMVGCHLHGKAGFLAAAVRWPGTAAEEKELSRMALDCLQQVGLAERAHDEATALPFGQQRLVEIARALAVRPTLLLLDEPAAGLSRVEAEALNELIVQIRAAGISVCLVEHDMNLVMDIADRLIVLQHGSKIADGPPQMVQADAAVITAYLGRDWQTTAACPETDEEQDAPLSPAAAALRRAAKV